MIRDQEILTRAMNFVDEELIASAHAPRKKLRHYTPTLIAACLCVVIVATFPMLRDFVGSRDKTTDALPPSDAGNAGSWYTQVAPSLPMPGLGDTVRIGANELTLLELTETTATFKLVKRDSSPLYAAIRQYAGGLLASTEPDYRDNGTILRPRQIRVEVDGVDQPAATLPIPQGTYMIQLDFSSLRNGNYRIDDTLFFYSYTGEEGAIEHIRFNITPPAVTESESETAHETGEETVDESGASTESDTAP